MDDQPAPATALEEFLQGLEERLAACPTDVLLVGVRGSVVTVTAQGDPAVRLHNSAHRDLQTCVTMIRQLLIERDGWHEQHDAMARDQETTRAQRDDARQLLARMGPVALAGLDVVFTRRVYLDTRTSGTWDAHKKAADELVAAVAAVSGDEIWKTREICTGGG